MASENLAEKIGAAIREGRKARHWTQATLAEKLDLSVTYVGMVERGENLPSLSLLLQAAEVLGTSLAALVGEPTAEPWAAETLAMMRLLPPSGRDMVLDMLRGAAGRAAQAPATPEGSGVRPKKRRRG